MSITNCQHSLETVTANMGLAVIELKICSNCLKTEIEINQAEKLEKAEKVLEFYANRFSWEWTEHDDEEYFSATIRNDHSDVKFIENDGTEHENLCGGKLARQALKEIRGEV